jgi:hypothetical protein
MTRWTERRLNAVLNAASAMRAGEVGKGDWGPDVTAADLDGGMTCLHHEILRLRHPVKRQSSASIKRLTAKTKRGIAEILRLAYADVECSEPGDWTHAQRDELSRGFEYLAALIGVRP